MTGALSYGGRGPPDQKLGHAKIAGRVLLRTGLSPLATTISTPQSAPVICGIRLRAGQAGSGRGAASMVTQAIGTARAAGAGGRILVRGDSAFGNHAVVGACLKAGVEFSVVLAKNPAVTRAIASIPEVNAVKVVSATSASFAGSVTGPEAGELFPVWRHHPFFTNSTEPTTEADITHRRHAIIETVFADLIDGPLAHLPSGRFASHTAWAICAAITHNLLRATGTLTSTAHRVARGATLRRQLITVPARIAGPQRRPVLHLPSHWPWARHWQHLWQQVFSPATGPPLAA